MKHFILLFLLLVTPSIASDGVFTPYECFVESSLMVNGQPQKFRSETKTVGVYQDDGSVENTEFQIPGTDGAIQLYIIFGDSDVYGTGYRASAMYYNADRLLQQAVLDVEKLGSMFHMRFWHHKEGDANTHLFDISCKHPEFVRH